MPLKDGYSDMEQTFQVQFALMKIDLSTYHLMGEPLRSLIIVVLPYMAGPSTSSNSGDEPFLLAPEELSCGTTI